MILSGLIQIIRILMDFFKKNGFFNNPAYPNNIWWYNVAGIIKLGALKTNKWLLCLQYHFQKALFKGIITLHEAHD